MHQPPDRQPEGERNPAHQVLHYPLPLLLTPDPTSGLLDLTELAVRIRKAWETAHAPGGDRIICAIQIGHALLAAKQQLGSTRSYGEWFRAQHFPFTIEWARTMQITAEKDAEVVMYILKARDKGDKPTLADFFRKRR